MEKAVGCELIKTVHLMMRKTVNAEAKLPHVQGRVLSLLWQRQSADTYQKDVEKEFGITRSTASSLLSRMEREGLLTRSGVSFDARLKKLSLTEKGASICQRTEKSFADTEERLRNGISRENMDIFFQVLREIRQNLNGSEEEA